MTPHVLILRTAGTNCDAELAHAFTLAGGRVETLHVHEVIAEPAVLERFAILGFPGGFSYGDDIAAGRIFANRLVHRLLEPLRAAIDRGALAIGVCNGFQVLVKAGLLPDPHAGKQTATLADNTSGRFVDRWAGVSVPAETVCVWTAGLTEPFELPIAHGEGRFTAPPDVLDALERNGQVALRYAEDDNPNGSARHIAGVCDPTGRVLGLMPHPERYSDPTHHPQWTRRRKAFLEAETPGLRMFRNAIKAAQHQPTPA